jgi:hypothetical protein
MKVLAEVDLLMSTQRTRRAPLRCLDYITNITNLISVSGATSIYSSRLPSTTPYFLGEPVAFDGEPFALVGLGVAVVGVTFGVGSGLVAANFPLACCLC